MSWRTYEGLDHGAKFPRWGYVDAGLHGLAGLELLVVLSGEEVGSVAPADGLGVGVVDGEYAQFHCE